MRLLPKNKVPKHLGDPGLAPYIWLVFLAFFYLPPILDPRTTRTYWLVTIVATVVFLSLSFAIFWCQRPWNYLIIAATVSLGWTVENARRSLMAVAGLIVVLGVDGVFFHAPVGFGGTSMIVSIGVGLSNT